MKIDPKIEKEQPMYENTVRLILLVLLANIPNVILLHAMFNQMQLQLILGIT